MNEPGFENSMFTDEKSYEINIHAWVCIQNTITGYKRVPQLILPNYNTLRINLFWTNSQAVETDVSINEVRNSYFDEWIPLENDKSFIYTDYEVALVVAFWEGWFEWQFATNKFACHWKPIL